MEDVCSDVQNIDHHRHSDSPPTTVPPNILTTSLRPDIVIITEESKHILILELTVPTNTIDGLENARRRKQNKQEYGSLINDIVSAGHYSVTYDTIEVGTLGHFIIDSIKSLRKALISRSDNSMKCSRSILTKAA